MKDKFVNLKSFNWRLWVALCSLALIPAVYQTVKTFLITSVGDNGVFDIIGQMEWFDLINETLQAFLIVPLYAILNSVYKSDKERFSEYAFKTGLTTFALYTLFSVGVLIYGSVLVKAMNPDGIDLSVTNTYLRLETVAFVFGIVPSFASVVFVVLGKDKNVYVFLAVKTVLSLIVDIALIPNLGIYGVAISNITVNALLAASCTAILYFQKHIRFKPFNRADKALFKNWCKIGLFSGMQQFTDNFIYAVMVCKMVNMVAEQGNYWIANNFIWGWLLIPITALAEIIRSDCKSGYNNLKQFNYYFIAGSVVALWILSIPAWIPFFRYAENLSNADEIFFITIKLFPFYIAYAGCVIIDNIFIGLGKTLYNAINSLIINIIYYGVFFILYLTEAMVFDIDAIILMFGFGMVVHLCVSVIEQLIFRRKNGLVLTGDG